MPQALNLLDPQSLAGAGVLIVALVLFAETGILLGLFLPGDTLLFAAGFLTLDPTHHLSLVALLIVTPIAALVGGEVGFLIGRRLGPALFSRPDSRLFKQAYLQRARQHSERFGVGKSIVLGRFVPVVRTLIGPFYGASGLYNKVYARWNAIGAFVWTWGVTLLGWGVAHAIGLKRAKELNIDKYLLPLVAVAVLLSFLGLWRELRKARRADETETPSQGANS
ncbi:MAG: associated Golgi protein-like protein [Frankiales bacterium]|nr:associated Golgi protein-like protein [Frankiales bacterium]